MPEPEGERELAARRGTEHRSAFAGQRGSETRAHPPADVLDEELLVGREPFRVKDRRVLMEPRRLIGQPVYTDDHRGPDAGRLEEPAPLRDPLTVTGEDDRLRRIRRDVRRHRPAAVVSERLSDEPWPGHARRLAASQVSASGTLSSVAMI